MPLDTTTYIDRNEAIAELRSILKAKTGTTWSVTGGRGTVWGWITVTAPPKRRVNGSLSEADQATLTEVFGTPVHHQGLSIPASSAYRREYINRAKGEPFEVAEPYWD